MHMGERLTQGDIDKIKKEIEYRTLVVRKEAIEAVSEARAQGDLSENFEYYAAKKDKNKKVNLGGSYRREIAVKYKKPKTRGDKFANNKKKKR